MMSHALDLGGVLQEQKMLKGHLPRVMYHQIYEYAKTRYWLHSTPLAWSGIPLNLYDFGAMLGKGFTSSKAHPPYHTGIERGSLDQG